MLNGASSRITFVFEEAPVPWQPEDWQDWSAERWLTAPNAHLRALREILARLPDARSKTVVELTRERRAPLPFLAERFDRVLTASPDLGGSSALDVRGGFDVAVAVDTIHAPAAGAVFGRLHHALSEGGVFLATFPAQAKGSSAILMEVGVPSLQFHEFELQFRLGAAGFQGLRLRRLPGSLPEPDRLLSMAVRRALN